MQDTSIIDLNTLDYENTIIDEYRHEPISFPTFDPSRAISITPNSGYPYTNPHDYSAEFEARKMQLAKAKRRGI
jgi:hypothetical protein